MKRFNANANYVLDTGKGTIARPIVVQTADTFYTAVQALSRTAVMRSGGKAYLIYAGSGPEITRRIRIAGLIRGEIRAPGGRSWDAVWRLPLRAGDYSRAAAKAAFWLTYGKAPPRGYPDSPAPVPAAAPAPDPAPALVPAPDSDSDPDPRLIKTWANTLFKAARAVAPTACLHAVWRAFLIYLDFPATRRIRVSGAVFGEIRSPESTLWRACWRAPLAAADITQAALRAVCWLGSGGSPSPSAPPAPAAAPAPAADSVAVLAEDLEWTRMWNARHNRWYGARIEDAAAVLTAAEEADRAGDPVSARELRAVVREVIDDIMSRGMSERGTEVPR